LPRLKVVTSDVTRYSPTEKEFHCILAPKDVYGKDFPGKTFRVLKEKELCLYSENRTRRLVLEAWEETT